MSGITIMRSGDTITIYSPIGKYDLTLSDAKRLEMDLAFVLGKDFIFSLHQFTPGKLTLGRLAYEAYRFSKKNRIKEWDKLSRKTKNAWEAAAKAVQENFSFAQGLDIREREREREQREIEKRNA
jgi:hypothetical protein